MLGMLNVGTKIEVLVEQEVLFQGIVAAASIVAEVS